MAGLDRFRVVVGTGHGGQAGVVVRRPGVLVVASVSRPETIETTKRLLALCAEVTSEAGSPATTGSRLVRRVAGLLVDAEAERVPDFGLLTTVNDRIAALVHGAMDVVTGGPAPVSLSGVDSATWVDRLLPLETTRIDIGPTEAMPSLLQAGLAGLTGLRGLDDLGFPLDLRVGAVPGTAASLIVDDDAAVAAAALGSGDAFLSGFEPPREPMTEAAPIPTPGRRMPDQLSTAPPALTPLLSKDDEAHRRLAAAAEPTQAADFDELDEDPPTTLAERELASRGQGHDGHGAEHLHDDLHDDLDDDQDALTQLPGDPTFTVSDLIEDDDAETMLPNAAQPQVEGIMCANGHFNHPQAPYCAECGISLAQQTNRTVLGPRPPIGVLVFDDGQTVNVDMDLVIGRQPDRDEAVRAGNARPLPVEDGESAVSRVHAVITLNGWDAVITDRGSANGTYIAPPEATVWTPLSPHQPAPLVPGTRVQVGKRTFVFNSHIQV
ncbi:FHA domain-containing protein [Parafrankia elaeagni]|uniref:FHA domain-containing protein n=1 Tax=Parafrankia elaeagni TaxID=222534 RepID=UPI00036CA45C|nr:FHA domain-containing protein [Parafrankia elaeagni]